MTAESNAPHAAPPAAAMSLEDLQHWTQMLGRAQQLMLEQGIDLLERTPAIPDPTGGTVVDSQARAAIGAILGTLRGHGLIGG